MKRAISAWKSIVAALGGAVLMISIGATINGGCNVYARAQHEHPSIESKIEALRGDIKALDGKFDTTIRLLGGPTPQPKAPACLVPYAP